MNKAFTVSLTTAWVRSNIQYSKCLWNYSGIFCRIFLSQIQVAIFVWILLCSLISTPFSPHTTFHLRQKKCPISFRRFVCGKIRMKFYNKMADSSSSSYKCWLLGQYEDDNAYIFGLSWETKTECTFVHIVQVNSFSSLSIWKRQAMILQNACRSTIHSFSISPFHESVWHTHNLHNGIACGVDGVQRIWIRRIFLCVYLSVLWVLSFRCVYKMPIFKQDMSPYQSSSPLRKLTYAYICMTCMGNMYKVRKSDGDNKEHKNEHTYHSMYVVQDSIQCTVYTNCATFHMWI